MLDRYVQVRPHRFICFERFSVVQWFPGNAMVGFELARWFAGLSIAFLESKTLSVSSLFSLLWSCSHRSGFVDDWSSFLQKPWDWAISSTLDLWVSLHVVLLRWSHPSHKCPFTSQACLFYDRVPSFFSLVMQLSSARSSKLEDFVPQAIGVLSGAAWFIIRSSSGQLSIGCHHVWMTCFALS